MRPLLISPSALALLSGVLPLHAQQGESPRPNVLLIYADDLGYADLGCYGAKNVQG